MVLSDLIVYLDGLALVSSGVDIFAGTLPPSPTECCALLEYAGDPPLRNQTEGNARSGAQSGERPRIQLLCRSDTYDAGRSLIGSIWSVLDGVVNQTINGTFYVRIKSIQSPFLLQRTPNDHWIFAVNFMVTKAV